MYARRVFGTFRRKLNAKSRQEALLEFYKALPTLDI
jgi:hypothetical protein